MKLLCFSILCFSFSMAVFGQEAITTSGSNASGSGGSSSYTVGQVIYTTNFAETGSVAQGVQHPNLEVITNVTSSIFEGVIQLYPNPTLDQLHLSIESWNFQDELYYTLYGIDGKRFFTGAITALQTTIKMEHLPASNYVLELNNGKDQHQSYKIIKLK